MPFEERTIQRATRFRGPDDCEITTCSAEDLIVHKAFANRAQDWIDIQGIVTRTRSLDKDLIMAELTPLATLREDLEPVQKIAALLDR